MQLLTFCGVGIWNYTKSKSECSDSNTKWLKLYIFLKSISGLQEKISNFLHSFHFWKLKTDIHINGGLFYTVSVD